MYVPQRFRRGLRRQRNAQFRAQVERRIDGALTEDEFKPLRLMNGLYLQLHAYMLRVAIPYGTLNAARCAAGADRRDLGQGLRPLHHAPEHPVQLAAAPDVPDILGRTGRCRDARDPDQRQLHPQRDRRPFRGRRRRRGRGSAPDAELIRQWSTDHPEFQFLPRKFKIAITGARTTAR
jgi:sulfite reductase (NADPH) hemoprotein beta-component